MNKIKAGVGGLINPQSSEFWALLVGVIGYILTTTGVIPHQTWDAWSPGVLSYVGLRFVSKTAKG